MDMPRVYDANTHPGCCSVYVANIPVSVDSGRLRRLFSSVGNVLHVKLLLDIATGMSRGVAFVMFENADVANKACELLNRGVLDGNILQVRLSEKSSLHSCVDSHVRSSIVYIRNVPCNVTLEAVQSFCASNFGPVVNVSLHPQSYLLRGPSPYNMVFVHFLHMSDACRCVEDVDGKAPFPFPFLPHPFTVAKMINDVNVEKRKSIILCARRPTLGGTQIRAPIQPPVKQAPPPYIDSTAVNPIICDTTTHLIRSSPVVSFILPYQNTENYVAVVPAPLNAPDPHFVPQGRISTAYETGPFFLIPSQACQGLT
ncbi:RNA-binding protein [Trypanosoma grayi]|uniref:RNA-binding protein n=1 Tax=Trypanosoma grayi TaxID=71804 RepID=UPI0004F45586|nr:RNA-binding protein [Trypanosoma grayi]KEG10551.1 RNA-binding protein [Trypanosoma grayi]